MREEISPWLLWIVNEILSSEIIHIIIQSLCLTKTLHKPSGTSTVNILWKLCCLTWHKVDYLLLFVRPCRSVCGHERFRLKEKYWPLLDNSVNSQDKDCIWVIDAFSPQGLAVWKQQRLNALFWLTKKG